jgi:F420-non-reducing hydrogenase iron-sulfur subunit
LRPESRVHTDVVIFACNWDGWSCVETASNLGLLYPTSVKVIRVSCLSRLHTGLILKAFEFGAAGVILLGCQRDRCHFDADSDHIVNEHEKAQTILRMLGISEDRLVLAQVPAFQGREFVARVAKLVAEIEQARASRQARLLSSGAARGSEVELYS